MDLFPKNNGAELSEDRIFRWRLWREVGADPRCVCWIGLNPSKADAEVDDHTIGKMGGYTTRWGFGRLEVVNLYSFRATDPEELWRHEMSPGIIGGARGTRVILEAASRADLVLVCWGAAARARPRAEHVAGLLRAEGLELFCLRRNRDGSPAHPARLPWGEPERWES